MSAKLRFLLSAKNYDYHWKCRVYNWINVNKKCLVYDWISTYSLYFIVELLVLLKYIYSLWLNEQE